MISVLQRVGARTPHILARTLRSVSGGKMAGEGEESPTVQHHLFVDSLPDFKTALDHWSKNAESVYALFAAEWCPDCQNAEPHIIKAYQAVRRNTVLIQADMGDRPKWRDPENPFRLDETLNLERIPTLILMKGGERLVEGECCDDTKLHEFFSK
eukprot:comp15294_c0_seq1/m.12118 comp15294_c0_seq1/g.12118  ORF comp15294_c0_seq1/g.12118 comp15294_c0_seq1/m.12118 type:complete len:155 (-) comp15294_c0_seq1:140-604(-)